MKKLLTYAIGFVALLSLPVLAGNVQSNNASAVTNVCASLDSNGRCNITAAAQWAMDNQEALNLDCSQVYSVDTVTLKYNGAIRGVSKSCVLIYANDVSDHAFKTAASSTDAVFWELSGFRLIGQAGERNNGSNQYDLIHVDLADTLDLSSLIDAQHAMLVDSFYSINNVDAMSADRHCLYMDGRGEGQIRGFTCGESYSDGIHIAGGFDHKIWEVIVRGVGGDCIRATTSNTIINGKLYFCGYNIDHTGGSFTGREVGRGAGLRLLKNDYQTVNQFQGEVQDTSEEGIVIGGSGNIISAVVGFTHTNLYKSELTASLNQTDGAAILFLGGSNNENNVVNATVVHTAGGRTPDALKRGVRLESGAEDNAGNISVAPVTNGDLVKKSQAVSGDNDELVVN